MVLKVSRGLVRAEFVALHVAVVEAFDEGQRVGERASLEEGWCNGLERGFVRGLVDILAVNTPSKLTEGRRPALNEVVVALVTTSWSKLTWQTS